MSAIRTNSAEHNSRFVGKTGELAVLFKLVCTKAVLSPDGKCVSCSHTKMEL